MNIKIGTPVMYISDIPDKPPDFGYVTYILPVLRVNGTDYKVDWMRDSHPSWERKESIEEYHQVFLDNLHKSMV